MVNPAPCGSWASPITDESLVAGAAGLGEVVVDGDSASCVAQCDAARYDVIVVWTTLYPSAQQAPQQAASSANTSAASAEQGKAGGSPHKPPAASAVASPASTAIVEGPIVALHNDRSWTNLRHVSRCKVEDLSTSLAPVKAHRIYHEFMCSLESFKNVLNSVAHLRRFDPALDDISFYESKAVPAATVVHTSYKSAARVVAHRDFCSLTTGRMLTTREGADLGLYTSGIHSAAFIQASVDSDQVPPVDGYVRGKVHAAGYIAIATPPDAKRIRVYQLACVDPCGKIPGWVVDAAATENCKKFAKIRAMCEKLQRSVV